MKNNNDENQWLGVIPNDWKLIKGKYLFKQRSEKGNNFELQLLSPTQKYGIIPQSLYEKLSGFSAVKLDEKTDFNTLKTIHKGDYCISLRSFQGGLEYSEYEGVCSPAYQIFFPIVKLCTKYYKYLFKVQCFIDKINSFTLSLRDGKNIAFADFASTYLPYPPLDIQEKIADFLDKECSEIDALHTDIEKQIETLEEYKKSIITEAVTKGLINININGTQVDFTNTTDEQWECKKLKLLVAMPIIDGPHESPELCDTGIPYISATAIVDGKIDFNLMRGYISEEYCTECEKRYKPQLNDILVVKLGAGTGQVAMIDDNRKFNIWVPLAAVRCNELVIPKFIYYGFQSDYVVTQMEQSWTYGTQETLGVKTIEKLKFFIPTLNTQRKIIQYLDNKCVNIDGAIEEKKEQLETLEQYQKSLIYEYVTGKKEVR